MAGIDRIGGTVSRVSTASQLGTGDRRRAAASDLADVAARSRSIGNPDEQGPEVIGEVYRSMSSPGRSTWSCIRSRSSTSDGGAHGRLVIAQLRHRLMHAHPARVFLSGGWSAPVPLDFTRARRLDFSTVSGHRRLPARGWRYQALNGAASLPVASNAANGSPCISFLDGALSFPGIARVIRQTLDAHRPERCGHARAGARGRPWARTCAAEMARAIQLKV